GDMTGKALVPVIHDGGERWHATLLENREELVGEDKVAAFEDAVIRRGYYPFRTTPEGVRELQENEARWHGLFEEEMLKTVERWMQIADEKLAGTGVRCFVCPGNDDQLNVDGVIRAAKTVELAEGEVLHRPRRLDRRARRDRGAPAVPRAPRPHPRGEGHHPHRSNSLHQPGQLVRAGPTARRRRGPRRQEEGLALHPHERIRRNTM